MNQLHPDTNLPTNDSLRDKWIELLQMIGPGSMSRTVYDTAWVARLHQHPDFGTIAAEAIEWLRAQQLTDGSWGAKRPLYHHDRVICTLAALLALSEFGDAEDNGRISAGLHALEYHQAQLDKDIAGETIAFEMITPTLLIEAVRMGLISNKDTKKLRSLATAREDKLAKAPGKMIHRTQTMAFSAEMAGEDGLHILDVDNLQSENGSISYSPSATAYYLKYVDPTNQKAIHYLKNVLKDGAAPNVAPFDIFEPAWVLWNLSLTGLVDSEIRQLCQPHINYIKSYWHPDYGIGTASDWNRDGDDSGFIFEVLSRYGQTMSLKGVLYYEDAQWFRCFDLESNPSISTNVHILGALKHGELALDNPSVQKVRSFLQERQHEDGYWVDKWHASPYYPTTHLIVTCTAWDEELVERAVDWLVKTQNEDGSWGVFGATAEETAYCVQALVQWAKYGRFSHFTSIQKGVSWLKSYQHHPYPPLWIGKCLYAPELVIQSAVIGAIAMAESLLSQTSTAFVTE